MKMHTLIFWLASSLIGGTTIYAEANQKDRIALKGDGCSGMVILPPQVSAMDTVEAEVKVDCARPCKPNAFDARMPDHNHGMLIPGNQIQQRDQRYYVKLRMHMEGRWVLSVKCQLEGQTKKITGEYFKTL